MQAKYAGQRDNILLCVRQIFEYLNRAAPSDLDEMADVISRISIDGSDIHELYRTRNMISSSLGIVRQMKLMRGQAAREKTDEETQEEWI